MDEKVYFSDEFLKKAAELAQGQKFVAVPPNQKDLWVPRMWVYAVICTVYSFDYEIVKRKP